ncbi:MAG: tetratricopeptide repeat protein, partial [Alphaproteobacteria bacterium]|nr:tetratricopeptide repeat protein [Alphaproteobacteria bacterium]
TDRLVADLFRHCRGLSFTWAADERCAVDNLAPPNPSELIKYVVYGSVQQGGPGMLRVNMRISDPVTTDYLWAGRNEFQPEDLAPIPINVTRQICRALHLLLIQEAARCASVGSDPELDVNDCLNRGNAILKEVVRAETSAEAQQWFLAALARDLWNVEALIGLTRTCQYLVSNPWWGDPRAAAAAADLGRDAIEIALEQAPENAFARCIQGMLCSAAGHLQEAARAFAQALALDNGLAIAHGFGGYNAALLGRPWETLPAIERAVQLDPSDRRHSIWYFFGGFAELLLGHTEAAVVLLEKSLERNPSYGATLLFLMAALSLTGRHSDAARMAESFRRHYPESPANAFERFWLSRSPAPAYRAQIYPLFERICAIQVLS